MSVWKPDETLAPRFCILCIRFNIFLCAITTEMFCSGLRVKYYYPNIFYK